MLARRSPLYRILNMADFGEILLQRASIQRPGAMAEAVEQSSTMSGNNRRLLKVLAITAMPIVLKSPIVADRGERKSVLGTGR